MKKLMTLALLAALALGAAATFNSCSKSGDGPPEGHRTITVTADPAAGGTAVAVVPAGATGASVTAAPGTVVTLIATQNGSYLFDGWTVEAGGATLSPDAATSPATFIMPDADVSVKAAFSTNPKAAYYDRWRRTGDSDHIRDIDLSAGRLVWSHYARNNGYDFSYTLDDLEWTPVTNGGALAADYPAGYRIEGTLTSVEIFDPYTYSNYVAWKTDGSKTAAEVGERAALWFYIHRNNGSIREGDWGAQHYAIDDHLYEKGKPAVLIGAQQGDLTTGTAGRATFAVKLPNIPDGKTGTVTWHSYGDARTPISAPAGASATLGSVSGGAAILTVTTTVATPGNDMGNQPYYLRVTVDGTRSPFVPLYIAGARWIKVGAQQEDVYAALPQTYRTLTFRVLSGGIADGTYAAAFAEPYSYHLLAPFRVMPFGDGKITFAGGLGTLTVEVGYRQPNRYLYGGKYFPELKVIVPGGAAWVVSPPFTITVQGN